MEVWRDVAGFEGRYQISDLGRVKSLNYRKSSQARIMKPHRYKAGYEAVRLNGRWKKVHRLVAEAFVENPGNKREVNHINGDTCDNRATNLEWCTSSENSQHAWDTGLQKMTDERRAKHSRSVVCVETGVEFYGMQEAADIMKICRRNINACCLGDRETAGGYHWRYKEASV